MELHIGSRIFEIGKRTYIMGILNVTPDSFSDGDKFNNVEAAVKHTMLMIQQGADIIDIGGESTRPNHTSVNEDEELARVIPIIEAIRKETNIPISIDTYKGKVAEEAIKAGANLINDIWGFKKDPHIAKVAAKYNLPCCLMHNKESKTYTNIMDDIISDLQGSITIALTSGVKKENIILDPGIGFAKDYKTNLFVMNNIEKLTVLNCPILLGTSRKSIIGNTLNLPPTERIEGTIATTVIGIMKGCAFVRVHDVLENKRAAVMTDAIVRNRN